MITKKPLSKINVRTLLRAELGKVWSEPRPENPQGRVKRIYHGSTHRQCTHLISRGLLYKVKKAGFIEFFWPTEEGKKVLECLRDKKPHSQLAKLN